MVTIDLGTGEIIEGSFKRPDEDVPEFEENGVGYFLDDEWSFPRSETPRFLYDLVPDLDERSQIKLTMDESQEKIWLSEIKEGELAVLKFVPASSRTDEERSRADLYSDQDTWKKVAKSLGTHHQQQPERSVVISDSEDLQNLNHLLNRRG